MQHKIMGKMQAPNALEFQRSVKKCNGCNAKKVSIGGNLESAAPWTLWNIDTQKN